MFYICYVFLDKEKLMHCAVWLFTFVFCLSFYPVCQEWGEHPCAEELCGEDVPDDAGPVQQEEARPRSLPASNLPVVRQPEAVLSQQLAQLSWALSLKPEGKTTFVF